MTGAGNNAGQVLDARDGRLSAIAQLAKENLGDLKAARALLPVGAASLIQPTINAWLHGLRPLNAVEPKLDGSEARKVRQAFIPNAAKLRPDMDEGKAEVWTGSVVAALSDLPGRAIVHGMNRAIHHVFEFPSELEAKIREEAEDYRKRQYAYIAFLRELQDSIMGRTQLLPDERPADPLTEAEVRAMVNGGPMSKALISLGLKIGSIDPQVLARVQAEVGEDA